MTQQIKTTLRTIHQPVQGGPHFSLNNSLPMDQSLAPDPTSRFDTWLHFIKTQRVESMAEVGVYRGDFAAKVLNACDCISTYYMIDPWRHLNDWNKPANKNNDSFNRYLEETLSKTEMAASRRVILRGKTTEVIDEIADESLDFAYIDGDHTLKGISIDLVATFPKIKTGGFIGGDDFTSTVWQHSASFEPSLVFPFTVYFAEAVGATLWALPHSQFLMRKNRDREFQFIDSTGEYTDISLKNQFSPRNYLKAIFKEKKQKYTRILRKLKWR
jgi:hypothetical protein